MDNYRFKVSRSRRMATAIVVVLVLGSLLAACGGPTPTPEVVVVTATYTPKALVQVVTATPTPVTEVQVVTATYTPATEVKAVTATFTPMPGEAATAAPVPETTLEPTGAPVATAQQPAQPGATNTLAPPQPGPTVTLAWVEYVNYVHPSGAFSLDIPRDADYQEDDTGLYLSYADSLIMLYFTVLDEPLSPDDLEQTMLVVLDDALVGEGLISSYDDLAVQRNETGDAVASAFSMTSDVVGDGEGNLVLLQDGQTVYTMILLTPDYDAIEPVWETVTDTLLVTSVEVETPTDTPVQATDTPLPPTAKPASLKSYFVVYTSFGGPDLQDYSLWGMNGDGSGVFEVSGAGQASEPAFSPDGTKFAFYHWTDGLYIWDLTKETSTRIVDNGEASFPSWSPNGSRLAYANLYGQPAIYIVNSDGGNNYQLTPGLRPSWSLKGGFIAYDTCENNKCGIYRINPDGGGKRQLTSDGGGGSAVSPNGAQVAYWSREDGDFEVFVVNTDGSGKKQLTKNSGNDALPAWSPDGKYIYYLSDQNGKGWAVMVMNANGSNQRKIAKANAGSDPARGWQYQRITVTWNE